jgi:L-iditol 2-dehydrogenase/galactitol-1-phosphate 5-dehydrogenase
MVAQWLRLKGCERVTIVEIDAQKIAIAREMGFRTINAKADDPVEALRKAEDGRGADRVVEACGTPVTFLQAVRSAARFGEVVFLGNIHGEFRIGEKDFSDILRRELTIYGTWNSRFVPRGRDDWSVSLRHLGREIQAAPLISHVVSLAEAGSVMEDIAHGRFGFHNKVVFKIPE